MRFSRYRQLALPIGVVAVLACFGAGRAEAQIKLDLPQGQEKARLISGAQKGIESALNFKEAYNALQQIGKSEEQLKAMAKAAEGLAKLGSSLSMVGAGIGVGLGVLEMFGVIESDAEKLDKALKEISGKIDRLDEQMNGRFDILETKLELMGKKIEAEIAKTQVRPYINKLETLQEIVELYYKHLAAKDPDYGLIDDDESQLAKYNPTDIMEAVNGIHGSVLGTKFATNLIAAEYESFYGDMSRLAETTYLLTRISSQAEHNYVLVKTLHLKRGNEDDLVKAVPSAKDRVLRNPNHPYFATPLNYADTAPFITKANEIFGPKLQDISKALDMYTAKAILERQAKAMMFLEDRIGGKANATRKRQADPGAWGGEGQRSVSGLFKKIPEKTDFASKYGPLVDELKSKYLCDWLVMAYHPIQRVSQGEFSGFANFNTFNWSGTHCIWFMENDADMVGSQLTYVLFHWTATPAPAQKIKREVEQREQMDYTGGTSATLYGGITSTNAILEGSSDGWVKTSLAMVFRVAGPGAGGSNAQKANGGSVTFDAYASPKISQPSPGEIKSPDVVHGSVDPRNVGRYGELYIKTTSPTRLSIRQGKGKLVVMHTNAR